MHGHISIAYNSERPTGMKLEDFLVSGNLCLFTH